MAKFFVLLAASILSIEMLASIRNDGHWQTIGEELVEQAKTESLTSKDDVNPRTPNAYSDNSESKLTGFEHYIKECSQDDLDCVKFRRHSHKGEHQTKWMDVEFDDQSYKVERTSIQEDLSIREVELPFSLDANKDKLATLQIKHTFPHEDFVDDKLTSRGRSFRDSGNVSNRIPKTHGSKEEGPSKGRYCYSTDPNPYMGFAAMTTYKSRANLKKRVVPKGCQPKHIWILLRPGSYSANKADMARFQEQLPPLKRLIVKSHSMGNGNLCPQDVALLRTWKRKSMEKRPPGSLTTLGNEELSSIAEHFSLAFPDLMIQPLKVLLSPQEKVLEKPAKGTKFAFAPTRQTQQSTMAFIRALYGNVWGHIELPRYGLPILQFLDKCKKYVDAVLMKPKEAKPYHTFKKGKAMKTLLQRVSGRLGATMSVTKIRTMYNACRYQRILETRKPSPWCVAFTERDLKVLEYWEDLRMYYDNGYAHRIAYKPACVLARDISVNFLRRIKCNITDTNATVYFVNTEAFLAFTARFGLFKDQKVLSARYINATRQWQTSRFASFGSNLAFILSSCADNTWWVSAVHNGAPIQLPGCEKPLGCSFRRFFSLFGFEDCNFIKICGRSRRYLWQSKAWHQYYSSHDWM